MSFKNLSVKAKLLAGFGFVIFLSAVLSIFAIFTLRSVDVGYKELLQFPQVRLKQILVIEKNIMDIRRITTAINAYVGDTARLEGYKTESASVIGNINASTDTYIELINNDPGLSSAEASIIAGKAETLKTVLAEYKKNLIDPNIESAIAGDKASVVSNAAQNAPLISRLSETIAELTQQEDELTAEMTEVMARNERFYQNMFIAFAVVIAVISLIAAYGISGLLTKPIRAMAKYMNQINKTGNLFFPDREWEEAQKIASGKDEIAQFLSGFIKMLKQFRYYGKCLEKIAAQDLTDRVNIISDDDTCGVSLVKMQETLNDMLSEINVVSDQVAVDAHQSEKAAQELSAGAGEQSTAILKFTESMNGLRDEANINAETSTTALNDVRKAEQLMKDSMASMERMLNAMRDIDAHSQRISKVIKTIDDIAFQTNILALNAAVEASRAGQHGKGFTVVADEVRDLASKSAEAARETAGLIESSVKSVQEGNNIVAMVNDGLRAVVSISGDNALSIEKLQLASTRQSVAVSETAKTIAELSAVVQANSETAREVAAASEEMSLQSNLLKEIVKQFKVDTTLKTLKPVHESHALGSY